MSAEDIKQAVLALYNTHQPADRERANQYLMQFAEGESAWIISLELLTTCPIPEVSSSNVQGLHMLPSYLDALHNSVCTPSSACLVCAFTPCHDRRLQ
eukprot:50209-Eustigmatos_ZCMA.PRE.1